MKPSFLAGSTPQPPRANYQLFLSELCDFLDVPRPHPTEAEERRNTYVFEKAVDFDNLDGTVSQGRIDLYRRSHLVLEAKQGSDPPVLQAAFQAEDRSDAGDLILTSPSPRPQRTRRGAARGTGTWPCSTPTIRPSATPRRCPPRRDRLRS